LGIAAQEVDRLHRIHAADGAIEPALVEIGVARKEDKRDGDKGG